MLQESLGQENKVPVKARRGSEKLGHRRVDAVDGTYLLSRGTHIDHNKEKQGFEPKCSHHS